MINVIKWRLPQSLYTLAHCAGAPVGAEHPGRSVSALLQAREKFYFVTETQYVQNWNNLYPYF